MRRRDALAALAALMTALASPAGAASGAGRSFERVFPVAGPAALEALTLAGRVEVRAGSEGKVTVGGTVRRAVSWGGLRVADAELERLRSAPPVRLEGATVRIERVPEEALWRGVVIDYRVTVPPGARVMVETRSGSVSVSGVRGGVSAETQSGAIGVSATGGEVATKSGSGAVRIAGAADAVSAATESGAIEVDGPVARDAGLASGSGSVSASGVRGSLKAETRSGAIAIAGSPGGDWTVRSDSGSVSIRVPADSRFELAARSRSGRVTSGFVVTGAAAPTKNAVEGAVNGGGPRLRIETGSSAIGVRP